MASQANQKTAIVVGAGAGGVATAARLAQCGYKVTLLEKNSFTGGRCSLITHNGFRFDQGACLLLLPKFFHETFCDLGTSLEAEGVKLLKCEPNYSIWFEDGESFEHSTDISIMKREIEKWEGKGGFERYLRWLGEAHRHCEILVKEILHRNFTSIFDLLRPRFLANIFELHPFESVYSRAARYFYTEKLRRVFTWSTMYMGMSPFNALGTFSLLQYTELADGVWYPVGGFHAIVAALVRICERLGVDMRMNTPVETILTTKDGKKVTGVRLKGGEVLESDLVVVNADLVYAYNNLFSSPTPDAYAKSLQKRAGSCSTITFYWSFSEKIPQLNTHNTFLTDQYRESFDSIFDELDIPREPSFYITVPSRVDSSAAPEGKDAIVVLVPVGHLLNSAMSSKLEGNSNVSPNAGLKQERDWQSLASSVRKYVLSTIKSRTGCVDLEPLIENEIINTPVEWESKFNLDKGSILGLSHSSMNILAFRPKTKHPRIEGVYFVGASTHPGTGVALVLAGSKITTQQILTDRKEAIPWIWKRFESRDRVRQRRETRESDGINDLWILGNLIVALLAVLCLIYRR